MGYNEELAAGARNLLAGVPNVTERKMFGGIAFLIAGNMACGIVGADLMVRLGEDGAHAALDEPHVRPMDFTHRPMKTMVYVEPAGTSSPDALRSWIDKAVTYASRLPPK